MWLSRSPSFFVISDRLEELAVEPVGMANFYDALLRHSFGNFRDSASPGSVGEATRADVTAALDNLFYHPNTGPFIARHLIQRLITSNPTPSYVSRVAAVFADNGQGVRGDLAAVVKALLLDPEARSYQAREAPSFGKLREPFLRCVNLARAFDACYSWGITSMGCRSGEPRSSLEFSPGKSPDSPV